MSSTRFDTEKFHGKNDFALWQIKMHALLVQQGLDEALSPSRFKLKQEDLSADQKAKVEQIDKKARSAIILCLSDKVLREVVKENSAADVWMKLESLYMTKSLANRLYMKKRLYSMRFLEEIPLTKEYNILSEDRDVMQMLSHLSQNQRTFSVYVDHGLDYQEETPDLELDRGCNSYEIEQHTRELIDGHSSEDDEYQPSHEDETDDDLEDVELASEDEEDVFDKLVGQVEDDEGIETEKEPVVSDYEDSDGEINSSSTKDEFEAARKRSKRVR
ncbi:uncharacterized protein LOC131004555 [Salvia miltiorrhiza]|uniref:uncharacterized protein LOC131004555 n=1 Tax=Salvia miltiorrhiza TaxID=226208 RepID=UPI0025AC3562|nr:uncharacterized protein LOC131004555 [Salvia miltiorrhiza]